MKKKILVVDDEPHIADLVKLTLQDEFEVLESFTSHDAINTVKKQKPDLVLLDIMMPGEDGFRICEKIRKMKEHKDIPIIFISAKAQIEDKMNSLKAGADDYITKPFDPEELAKKVKFWLRDKNE